MRSFSQRWFAALALFCLICGPVHAQGVSATKITLGQSISLQGGRYAYGVSVLNGMKLHFDQVNAAGGVFGRQVALRTLDDDGKADKAEANARQLATEDIFAFFGSVDGGPSIAVMKVANETGIPLFGPVAGTPGFRNPHQPLVFPVRAGHKEEFRALMEWGITSKYKTVGFIRSDSSVGLAHLANVQAIAKEFALPFVLDIPFKGEIGDAQVNEFVKAIGAQAPELMLANASPDWLHKLVIASKSAGHKTAFVSVNSGSTLIAKNLGASGHGMVFAQVVPSPWARKMAISREYQDAARKANPAAEFSYSEMEGYLTAKAMVMSLRAAGRDLTLPRWKQSMANARFDLGGLTTYYEEGNHQGSKFVDLSVVRKSGGFLQ